MKKASAFRKYFVPGFVFQSVVIAGGYGTGAELMEFFLQFGPRGGLVAMIAVSMVVWSIVCAATYEFARMFRVYNYRTMFQKLLGKGWVLYEICYVVLLMIVLAVIASSAGSILEELLGLNYYVGVVGLMIGVGTLVYFGTSAIENVLAFWSMVLYAVYGLFMIMVFMKYGGNISEAIGSGGMQSGWFMGGLKYAFYNLGIIPAVLFSLSHVETRKEAVVSGLLTGVIGIIPGVFLFLSMVGFYPEIMDKTVPTVFMLSQLGFPWLQVLFQVVLFGTLIETGTGFIFAVTERFNSWRVDQGLQPSKAMSMGITVALLIAGAVIAQFGLIGLIAKGYGTISWGFLLIYVLPILTLGIWKILQADKDPSRVTTP